MTTLRDVGPNYRCITYGNGTFVEAPHNWRRHVPPGPVREAIKRLTADAPTRPIYAEGLAESFDAHRLTKRGYLIPVEAWDSAPVDAPAEG